MNRRQTLQLLGASAGTLAGAGLLGRYVLLPPPPSRELADVQTLAARLHDSLDPAARARACVPYDHPLRQYHNRGVRGGGLPLGPFGATSRAQRAILTDMFHAGLSTAGRERVPHEHFVNWPGVHLMSVLVCGDPSAPPWQVVLSGPHLNLRLGGTCREGVAFGGPQVYGDQRGNGRQGLPSNVYRYQFQTAQRLFQSLSSAQKRAALLARAPIQTQIELQGQGGVFSGTPIASLAQASRALVHELLTDILSSYPAEDVDYAWRCLEHNGGLDALYLAYYEDGELAHSGEYQIFRIEGPAAVFYFRGAPHVHAFVNVAMDGERPLSVGAELGVNPAPLEGEGVRRLFEHVLRAHTGCDLAYYAPDSVVGRLRAGPIRAGDVYNLESWQDVVTVVEVRGASLRPALVAELRRSGADPLPGRMCSIATTGHVARELASDRLGQVESRKPGIALRDAAIAYLAQHGFPSTS